MNTFIGVILIFAGIMSFFVISFFGIVMMTFTYDNPNETPESLRFRRQGKIFLVCCMVLGLVAGYYLGAWGWSFL